MISFLKRHTSTSYRVRGRGSCRVQRRIVTGVHSDDAKDSPFLASHLGFFLAPYLKCHHPDISLLFPLSGVKVVIIFGIFICKMRWTATGPDL